jgi:hypothetical protein
LEITLAWQWLLPDQLLRDLIVQQLRLRLFDIFHLNFGGFLFSNHVTPGTFHHPNLKKNKFSPKKIKVYGPKPKIACKQ